METQLLWIAWSTIQWNCWFSVRDDLTNIASVTKKMPISSDFLLVRFSPKCISSQKQWCCEDSVARSYWARYQNYWVSRPWCMSSQASIRENHEIDKKQMVSFDVGITFFSKDEMVLEEATQSCSPHTWHRGCLSLHNGVSVGCPLGF